MWFLIKKNSSLSDGAKHVFEIIRRSRYLPEQYLKIVNQVISHNAFFVHSENLLLAMLSDERSSVGEDALQKIIQGKKASNNAEIRFFKVPSVNFMASEYFEMIDWSHCVLTPPPVLSKVSNEELTEIVKTTDVAYGWEFSYFPCHTQAVERTVKLVTEASAAVCGHDARDDMIRATLQSRSIMPKFNIKSQYKL